MNNDKVERQMGVQVTNSPPLPRRAFLRRLGLGAVALGPGVALVSSASRAFAGKGGFHALFQSQPVTLHELPFFAPCAKSVAR